LKFGFALMKFFHVSSHKTTYLTLPSLFTTFVNSSLPPPSYIKCWPLILVFLCFLDLTFGLFLWIQIHMFWTTILIFLQHLIIIILTKLLLGNIMFFFNYLWFHIGRTCFLSLINSSSILCLFFSFLRYLQQLLFFWF
jgi:hypothetical protein